MASSDEIAQGWRAFVTAVASTEPFAHGAWSPLALYDDASNRNQLAKALAGEISDGAHGTFSGPDGILAHATTA